jgi:ribosome-binding factor A
MGSRPRLNTRDIELAHVGAGDRKTRQLCKQVERIVSLLFAGEVSDSHLSQLSVATVEPMAGASRLMVVVVSGTRDPQKLLEIRERLERARGFIRSEVAQEIHRKKAPELSFMVLPSHLGEGEAQE